MQSFEVFWTSGEEEFQHLYVMVLPESSNQEKFLPVYTPLKYTG